MILSARRKTILALSLAVGVALPDIVAAQQTAPADRCEGTLCDLYYGGSPPPPQPGEKAAAPKPLMVPSGGILGFFSGGNATQNPQGSTNAPAKRPLVGVGGGGLAAMARGEAPERCSGTICDFYYGGPPPEKTAPAGQAPAADQQAAVAPAPDADLAPEQPRVRYRALPEEKPRCAPKAHDPWSCYR